MPAPPPAKLPSSGGINVGDVGGDVSFHALGDIVAGAKITNITIQISVEAVTQRPLITTSPYRGLNRFDDRDRDLFFGRDQLINNLLGQLSNTNVLLVLGASGSGKSSLVRAGLLPRLSQLLGFKFRPFTLVPDEDPFLSLRGALQAGGFSQAQARELLDAQPDATTRLISGLQQEGDQLLIFVDQFEEVFRVSERLGTDFISTLVNIARGPTGSIKLVLAMRADFSDRLSPFPQFARLIEKNIAFVTDMQVDELRLAIEQPAAQHGIVFEQGLVEEIIKDVQGQAGSLPLLQYTLDLLWQEEQRRDRLVDRHLNTQAYRQLGGVRGALQKRADEIYASFGDGGDPKSESARQKIVRQIFLRVVDLAGEGSDEGVWRPVRRRVPKTNFSSPQEQEILQALIDQKLLVSSGGQGAEATVEVAHEALFTSWERLKEWIEDGKQVIFARNRLVDDARRWQSRRKEDEAGAEEELLSGSRLGQALDMRALGDFDTIFGGLAEAETRFLDASFALRDRRRQEEQERQQRELAHAQKLAEVERSKAEDAVLATKKAIEVASRGNVSLARYSKDGKKTAQALAHLAQALRLNPENRDASELTAALLTQLSWPVPVTGSFLHHDVFRFAQFSPDGRRVVTVSWDRAVRLWGAVSATVRLWDAASGKPFGEPMKHEDRIYSVQFSPDGQRVVTASWDKTARLWDATSGKPLGKPMKHESSVKSAQFSPDGRRVVTLSADMARLWDAASGKPLGKPMKHEHITSAQFSPDDQRMMTASNDTTRLWDAASGKPIGKPMKHKDAVESAKLSPDGRRVVTLSPYMARLWDATNGKSLGKPMKHEVPVESAAFSPDSRRVVTFSAHMARLWDATSGKPIGDPMKHGSKVNSARFSPDGQRVVTASWDQTARLWDAASGKPIGEPMKHEDTVNSAEFSPEGQRVVTGSEDSTARLWDATSGKPIGEPIKHHKIRSVKFSPDGQWVMTASEDTARLWAAAYGKALGEPLQHQDGLSSAQFSPDGQRVVTASWDTTARLWDAASGKPIGEPMKHEGVVNSAQFSPDGQRVMTASADGTARLWNAANGKAIGEPMKHEDMVNSAQFSPDGKRVVTASNDKTAQLWDAGSGRPIGERMKHENSVTSAQFSPNSQRVVTVSWDEVVRLWDASGRPIGEPMKHDKRVISAQFSPDGQRVVTASFDQTAQLWDAGSGKPIGERMKHDWSVNSAQFSFDGQRIVTSGDSTARLWDAASGKPIGEPMKHDSSVDSAQFSPDGQRIVTTSMDDTAWLWDAASGKPIGEPMKHQGSVLSAQFSPEGHRVVTASMDCTARLWDAASGKSIGEPMEHKGPIASARFSRDGERVVTASWDETARLWDTVIATDKDTNEDIFSLAELGEATGGVTLETFGQTEILMVLTAEQTNATKEKIAAKYARTSSRLTPFQRLLKWSVSDRRNRTISPLSQETVSEWLENRIKERTIDGLRVAMQVDPANARVTAYLGRCLADYALKEDFYPDEDPDEARRARGEADSLTSRAVKLAPDNEEVKKLRDEVVKLLELKTN